MASNVSKGVSELRPATTVSLTGRPHPRLARKIQKLLKRDLISPEIFLQRATEAYELMYPGRGYTPGENGAELT